MLGNLNKQSKSSEKISFLKNVEILLKVREDVLNGFKSNLFPIMLDATPYATPDTTPRHTRSETSKLNEHFINEIKNEKKNKHRSI